MIKAFAVILVLAMAALPLAAIPQTQPAQNPPPQSAPNPKDEREEDRVQNAGKVLGEIMNVPETSPRFFLDRTTCVIILPGGIKASVWLLTGFFGGMFGRRVMSCRSGPHFDGPWAAPTMVALEGASWGFEGAAKLWTS